MIERQTWVLEQENIHPVFLYKIIKIMVSYLATYAFRLAKIISRISLPFNQHHNHSGYLIRLWELDGELPRYSRRFFFFRHFPILSKFEKTWFFLMFLKIYCTDKSKLAVLCRFWSFSTVNLQEYRNQVFPNFERIKKKGILENLLCLKI